MSIPYAREIEEYREQLAQLTRTMTDAGISMARATGELLRLQKIEKAARAALSDMDDCGDYVCIEEPFIVALESALDIRDRQNARENAAEAAYERSQEGECFRGGEAAAYNAEEMARIQRELK